MNQMQESTGRRVWRIVYPLLVYYGISILVGVIIGMILSARYISGLGQEIELEKGLALEKDLTLRVELVSKNGFKTVQQTVIIYATEFDFENAEYFKVYDTNGQLVWESDQYQ